MNQIPPPAPEEEICLQRHLLVKTEKSLRNLESWSYEIEEWIPYSTELGTELWDTQQQWSAHCTKQTCPCTATQFFGYIAIQQIGRYILRNYELPFALQQDFDTHYTFSQHRQPIHSDLDTQVNQWLEQHQDILKNTASYEQVPKTVQGVETFSSDSKESVLLKLRSSNHNPLGIDTWSAITRLWEVDSDQSIRYKMQSKNARDPGPAAPVRPLIAAHRQSNLAKGKGGGKGYPADKGKGEGKGKGKGGKDGKGRG